MDALNLDTLSTHLRQTGFLFPGSQIYGGLSNTWDFGPLGVLLKNNIKQAWFKAFVQKHPLNVGLDSAILMNPNVWKASGHLSTFNDPLMDCKACKTRHRADQLIEAYDASINAPAMTLAEMKQFIDDHHIACPNCQATDFTDIRQFNLMFKTFQGVTEESASTLYLRPETAQGIFVNYKNIQRALRLKVPFGVAQIGKSFRNEITPGQMIFRTREFEQMELEFFCKPDTDLQWYDYWKQYCFDWLLSLGLKKENLRFRDHAKEELSHYSKATCDIEYLFPWGWGELWGIADRSDYDLSQHQLYAKESMEYLDPETNEKYIPYVIEPSLGVERLFLALVSQAYQTETISENDQRIVLQLSPLLAPYKVCVLPLSKKLSEPAMKLYQQLSEQMMVDYDEAGSIGKRYRRQDQIGTPYCITVDFDSLEDGCITIRHRDTMQQERIAMDKITEFINQYESK